VSASPQVVLWGQHDEYGPNPIKITAGTRHAVNKERKFREAQGGWKGLEAKPVPMRDLIKRPTVGDTLDWAHGPGVVLEVGVNGRRVKVRDRIGRPWWTERAGHGHWVRIATVPPVSK